MGIFSKSELCTLVELLLSRSHIYTAYHTHKLIFVLLFQIHNVLQCLAEMKKLCGIKFSELTVSRKFTKIRTSQIKPAIQ